MPASKGIHRFLSFPKLSLLEVVFKTEENAQLTSLNISPIL
jgi:hypothetical protein